MPNTPLHRSFAVLYLTVGAVVLVQSIQTALAAVRDHLPIGDQHHAVVLGAAEILAAILFLVPRTMRRGADTEHADLERERGELAAGGPAEQEELAAIYVGRLTAAIGALFGTGVA